MLFTGRFLTCSFMHRTSFYIVNAITVYRLIAAFFLLYLIVIGYAELFKWLLLISFFTDAIDGFLARRFGVVTEVGSRLDSIADDLTVLMGIVGMTVFETGFVWDQLPLIFALVGLYFLQLLMAFIRYGRPTSFHTYIAKFATLLQGLFLILLFILPAWPVTLFHVAAFFTAMDLLEEIVLVMMLPTWQHDIKGLYWVLKRKKQHHAIAGKP